MSSTHKGGNIQPSLDLEEHISKGGINAKRSVSHSYDATSDSLDPLGRGLLGDTSSDTFEFSNYDPNGNAGTITIKKSGSTVATLTLTRDGDNNLTSIARS